MEINEIYRKRKEFFNEHAQKWDDMWYKDPLTGEYNKHREEFERLFYLVPLRKGDKVLDVGCGTGILVPYILEKAGGDVFLCELDYAYEMVNMNRTIHTEKDILFTVADAMYIPFKDGFWDIIICFSCFPHFHDKLKTLKSLSDALKKGGYLIISHFDSSEDLNKRHRCHEATKFDLLPDTQTMKDMFERARLNIKTFIDEKGFYYILAEK